MADKCVLIIEEEPILAQGLKVQFERWGFSRVELVNNFDDALVLSKNYPVILTLLDLKSDEAFLEKAFRLQEQHPHPLIFLSSFAIQSDRKRLKPFHLYRRINKPCHIPELRQAVESLLPIRLPKKE